MCSSHSTTDSQNLDTFSKNVFPKWFLGSVIIVMALLLANVLFGGYLRGHLSTVDATEAMMSTFQRVYSAEALRGKGAITHEALMDSLQKEIVEYEKVRNQILQRDIDQLNGYITFWLSVICAICTILPIVMTIQANINIQKTKEEMMRQMSSETAKWKGEAGDLHKKIHDGVQKMKRFEKLNQQTQLLVTLMGIVDYTNKQRPIQEDKKLIVKMIEEFKETFIQYKRLEKIEGDVSDNVNLRRVLMLLLRDVIYRFEIFFVDIYSRKEIETLKNQLNSSCDATLGDNNQESLAQYDTLISRVAEVMKAVIDTDIPDLDKSQQRTV